MTQTPTIALPPQYVAQARHLCGLLRTLDTILLAGDHACDGEERRLRDAALHLSEMAVRDAGNILANLEA